MSSQSARKFQVPTKNQPKRLQPQPDDFQGKSSLLRPSTYKSVVDNFSLQIETDSKNHNNDLGLLEIPFSQIIASQAHKQPTSNHLSSRQNMPAARNPILTREQRTMPVVAPKVHADQTRLISIQRGNGGRPELQKQQASKQAAGSTGHLTERQMGRVPTFLQERQQQQKQEGWGGGGLLQASGRANLFTGVGSTNHQQSKKSQAQQNQSMRSQQSVLLMDMPKNPKQQRHNGNDIGHSIDENQADDSTTTEQQLRQVLDDLAQLNETANLLSEERSNRASNLSNSMGYLREQLQDEIEREQTQRLAQHSADLSSFTDSVKQSIFRKETLDKQFGGGDANTVVCRSLTYD